MKSKEFYLKKISVFSIFWMVIAIKSIVLPEVGVRNYFDYIIWGLALLIVFFKYSRNHILEGFERNIFVAFFMLFIISVIGTFQNFTIHAFICVIAVACIGSFFIANSFVTQDNQMGYFEPLYIIMLLRILLRTLRGEYLGNTLPAFLLFSTLLFIVLLIDREEKKFRNKRRIFGSIWRFLVIAVSLGLMIFIGWNAASRTPIFSAVIIVIFFLTFRILKFKESAFQKLFWILVISLIICIYIYINVNTYSWYHALNDYSVLYFHKRIDSQRPDIWRFSLESLQWWQFIIGSGTGKLPTYSGYENSSFHNSYLQLLMQNGVVGLVALVLIFKLIWYKLAKHYDDIVCQFILAGFVGLIIYNTFECTLLQNKAFVGLVEWMFLSVGIVRARKLERENDL